MAFATITLAPIAFGGGVLLFLVIRWLRLVPGGVEGTLGYLLIVCSGYGLFYLAMTIDAFLLTPARLQQQYLGEHVAGPLSLTRFEAGGFQDPYMIWHYSLSQEQVEALRPRCRWDSSPPGHRTCTLYSASDERWFASVGLDGNELRMDDGLH